MRAILTVIGKDRVGIIAGVSAVLSECNANILDISQTVLQEYFAMVMLCDLKNMTVPFTEVKTLLEKKGLEMGLEIRIQHEDIFNAMHKI